MELKDVDLLLVKPQQLFQSHLYGIESDTDWMMKTFTFKFQSHLYGIERAIQDIVRLKVMVSIAPLWN